MKNFVYRYKFAVICVAFCCSVGIICFFSTGSVADEQCDYAVGKCVYSCRPSKSKSRMAIDLECKKKCEENYSECLENKKLRDSGKLMEVKVSGVNPFFYLDSPTDQDNSLKNKTKKAKDKCKDILFLCVELNRWEKDKAVKKEKNSLCSEKFDSCENEAEHLNDISR